MKERGLGREKKRVKKTPENLHEGRQKDRKQRDRHTEMVRDRKDRHLTNKDIQTQR